jgi:hypothetical protein
MYLATRSFVVVDRLCGRENYLAAPGALAVETGMLKEAAYDAGDLVLPILWHPDADGGESTVRPCLPPEVGPVDRDQCATAVPPEQYRSVGIGNTSAGTELG